MSTMTIEGRRLTAAGAIEALGPQTNEMQFRQWVTRGFIRPIPTETRGPQVFDLVDVVRGLILLDLQSTLGPTNGLAADVARALTPDEVLRLLNSEHPEITVDTDNGRVVFMPDPEVFEEFRSRLSRLR